MKILRYFIVALMLVMVIGIVSADEGDQVQVTGEAQDQEQVAGMNMVVQPVCDGVCLEGNQAVFRVSIENTGSVPLSFSQISLFDSDGIAFATQTLNPQESVVPAGETATVDVQGIVPPSTRGSTLYYTVGSVINEQAISDNMVRSLYVMPASEIECTSNDFCSGTDICYNYQCVPYSLFNSSEVAKPNKGVTTDSLQIGLLIVIVILLIVFILISLRNISKKRR